MLEIKDITIEKLENNELKKELPEIYELSEYHEINGWHDQDVLNHTIDVLKELKAIVESANPKVKEYLNEKIDKNTRDDLLFLATLYHDVGKKESFFDHGEKTSCPNHEEISAIKCEKLLDKFNITPNEKNYCLEMIRYHAEMHHIVGPENNEIELDIASFKEKRENIALELILLGFADTKGSELKLNDKHEFSFRMKEYESIIENYF